MLTSSELDIIGVKKITDWLCTHAFNTQFGGKEKSTDALEKRDVAAPYREDKLRLIPVCKRSNGVRVVGKWLIVR
jgi:hypothetical protein